MQHGSGTFFGKGAQAPPTGGFNPFPRRKPGAPAGTPCPPCCPPSCIAGGGTSGAPPAIPPINVPPIVFPDAPAPTNTGPEPPPAAAGGFNQVFGGEQMDLEGFQVGVPSQLNPNLGQRNPPRNGRALAAAMAQLKRVF